MLRDVRLLLRQASVGIQAELIDKYFKSCWDIVGKLPGVSRSTWTTRLEVVNEVVKATTDKWGHVFDAAGYGDDPAVQSAFFFKDLVNLLADIPKGLQELYIQLAAKNLVTYTTIGVMIGGFNEIADIALSKDVL